MFGWFKRKKNEPAKQPAVVSGRQSPPDEGVLRRVPEWSTFKSVREYTRFAQLVRDHFAAQGKTVAINDGIVYGATDSELQLGLQNLSQICCQAPADDWPDIIAEHFNTMREAERFNNEWEARQGDYAWAKQRLMVRIQPGEYLDAVSDRTAGKPIRLVYRVDLPETITMLVADFPTSTMTIDHELIEKWGVSAEQAFADAMQNVAQFAEVEWGELPTEEGEPPVTLGILSGEGYYSTTHVLRLQAWPERIGKHGTLIAIGNRGGALIFPVDSANCMQALNAMIPMAFGTFREGPGSISPHIYWRKPDGTFEIQRSELKENQLIFTPSKGFVAVLEMLAKEE